MSFSTLLSATGRQPVYMVEWEGDTVLSLDATTGWSAGTDAANLATTTTCKEGAAGLTFDKTGTTVDYFFIVNSTLTVMDMATPAYHRIWVYLPTLTGVDFVYVDAGQDVNNRWRWKWEETVLVAGWNHLYMPPSTVTGYCTSSVVIGSPSLSTVDYMHVGLGVSAAATTYTGVIVDHLTKHPYRYSTGAMTDPVAPTKIGWLQTPSIGTNAERVQDGSVNVGSASLSIVDDGATTLIADLDAFAFPGRTATIKAGKPEDAEDPAAEANWKPIYRGVTFSPQHLGRAWAFELSSLLEKLRRPIMQDATTSSTVTLTGNVVTAWLKLALSTGNGTNNPTYDTLTAVRGAGIAADLFDVTTIAGVRDDFLPNDSCAFEFNKPESDFLAWSFREVFRAYGIVPVVLPDGRLSIQAVVPPFGDDSTRLYSAANVLTPMPDYVETLDNLYNQVTVYYDYDVATDTYAAAPVRQGDTTSQARYGVRDLEIRSKGIPDSTTAQRVAKRILARLGNGAPPIRFEVGMSEQAIELGELVQIDHAQVPDIAAGTYGITDKLAEVVERGFNPSTGRVTLTLALTSYQAGNYRRIGPASLTTDYDGSSAAQRARYCFIADSSNYLGAANDAAHQIGPG
jgi:hypothetical protein